MPQIKTHVRTPAVLASFVILLASFALASCGGSSARSTTGSTSASAAAGSTGTTASGTTATTPPPTTSTAHDEHRHDAHGHDGADRAGYDFHQDDEKHAARDAAKIQSAGQQTAACAEQNAGRESRRLSQGAPRATAQRQRQQRLHGSRISGRDLQVHRQAAPPRQSAVAARTAPKASRTNSNSSLSPNAFAKKASTCRRRTRRAVARSWT